MKKSVVILGAVASGMLAGALPARADIAGVPQLQVTSAAALQPISPAARDRILDLPQLADKQFIEGGFSETGPDPKQFHQAHFHENPKLELRTPKNPKPKNPHHGRLSPSTDVAAAYLAFRKTDAA